MAKRADTRKLRAENEELRLRLEEAEQALEAIRTGQVDSLIIDGPSGPQIFSLEGATHSYRVLVESINEGAATLSENGTVLYCNGRFARLLEVPLQRLMGGSLREYVPERCRGAFDDLLDSARESSAREDLPLRASNGQEIPTYLSISSIVDGGRRVLCAVATDLRAQKRSEALAAAERAARESEDRLRLTLKYAAAGAWQWDIASGEVVWSPECYDLYGIDPAITRLTRADWERMLHDADRDSTVAAVKACIEGSADDFYAEFRIQNPRRGERWVLAIGRVERGTDGDALRMLGINIDITDRKRAEEALREADRRKDEFLGMLSHELRNPLAPMRNSAFVLEHADPAGEQATRARGIIKRQLEHLTHLVDDLLDVTRIARGKIELRRARVDLREVVSRAADDFRSIMDQHGIRFRTVIPDTTISTDADATRLTQIIGNLLHNAAKFTRPGGEVALSLAAQRGTAEISVRDTGAGIDPSLLPHLFDAFFQAERTLARTEGGLGLGLALVKAVAELHGGAVRVESAGKGKGAEFVVRLPLVAMAAVQDMGQPGAARKSAPCRVLIVEDNVDAAQSLAEVVALLGHLPEVAYDGPSAIAKARANPPKVVLCDIGLPGLSGYEVARALRTSGNGMQLIAVTGYAQPDDARRAIEAGFDGHLAKPVDPQVLERLLG